jgi:hypothetical protein
MNEMSNRKKTEKDEEILLAELQLKFENGSLTSSEASLWIRLRQKKIDAEPYYEPADPGPFG